MAWYWWVLIVLGIIILIGICSGEHDSYDEEGDWMFRLHALIIINDLKWTHPEKWAKMASDIIGKPVNPPTPEQITEYKSKHPEKFKN